MQIVCIFAEKSSLYSIFCNKWFNDMLNFQPFFCLRRIKKIEDVYLSLLLAYVSAVNIYSLILRNINVCNIFLEKYSRPTVEHFQQ